MEKIWQKIHTLVNEKEHSNFKPAILHLKIDIVSHSAHRGGAV